jgi:hypothetical protein
MVYLQHIDLRNFGDKVEQTYLQRMVLGEGWVFEKLNLKLCTEAQ